MALSILEKIPSMLRRSGFLLHIFPCTITMRIQSTGRQDALFAHPVWDPTFLFLIQVVLINSPDPQWAIFDQGANGFGGTSHAVPARDTLQFLCRSQQSPESERGIRIEDDRSPPIDLLYQENAARMMIPKESCLPPVPTSPSSDMCGHPYRCIFIAEIHSHAIYPAGWSDFKSSKDRRKRKIAMVKIENKEEMQTEGRANTWVLSVKPKEVQPDTRHP